MLAIVPFLNNNNSFLTTAMAQGYDIYRDNAYYSQYTTDVEQVHLKDFLLVQ